MLGRLLRDQAGATTLEYALLLGAVGIPLVLLLRLAGRALVGYYGMAASLTALPFP